MGAITPLLAPTRGSVHKVTRRIALDLWIAAPRRFEAWAREYLAETTLLNGFLRKVPEVAAVLEIIHDICSQSPHADLAGFHLSLVRLWAFFLVPGGADSDGERIKAYSEEILAFSASQSAKHRKNIRDVARECNVSEDQIEAAISKNQPRVYKEPHNHTKAPHSLRNPSSEKSAQQVDKQHVPQNPTEIENASVTLKNLLSSIPLFKIDTISPLECVSFSHLRTTCASLAKDFEGRETESNWLKREKHVNKLRSLLRSQLVLSSQKEFILLLKELDLIEGALKAVHLLRTTLLTNGCRLIKELFQLFDPNTFDAATSDHILSHALQLAALAKKISCNNAHAVICAILMQVYSLKGFNFRILQSISECTKEKTLLPRVFASTWISVILLKHPQGLERVSDSLGKSALSFASQSIARSLSDQSPLVREPARQSFWVLHKYYPETAQKLYDGFSVSVTKLLDKARPAGVVLQKSPQKPRARSAIGSRKTYLGLGSGGMPKSRSVSDGISSGVASNGIGKPVRINRKPVRSVSALSFVRPETLGEEKAQSSDLDEFNKSVAEKLVLKDDSDVEMDIAKAETLTEPFIRNQYLLANPNIEKDQNSSNVDIGIKTQTERNNSSTDAHSLSAPASRTTASTNEIYAAKPYKRSEKVDSVRNEQKPATHENPSFTKDLHLTSSLPILVELNSSAFDDCVKKLDKPDSQAVENLMNWVSANQITISQHSKLSSALHRIVETKPELLFPLVDITKLVMFVDMLILEDYVKLACYKGAENDMILEMARLLTADAVVSALGEVIKKDGRTQESGLRFLEALIGQGTGLQSFVDNLALEIILLWQNSGVQGVGKVLVALEKCYPTEFQAFLDDTFATNGESRNVLIGKMRSELEELMGKRKDTKMETPSKDKNLFKFLPLKDADFGLSPIKISDLNRDYGRLSDERRISNDMTKVIPTFDLKKKSSVAQEEINMLIEKSDPLLLMNHTTHKVRVYEDASQLDKIYSRLIDAQVMKYRLINFKLNGKGGDLILFENSSLCSVNQLKIVLDRLADGSFGVRDAGVLISALNRVTLTSERNAVRKWVCEQRGFDEIFNLVLFYMGTKNGPLLDSGLEELLVVMRLMVVVSKGKIGNGKLGKYWLLSERIINEIEKKEENDYIAKVFGLIGEILKELSVSNFSTILEKITGSMREKRPAGLRLKYYLQGISQSLTNGGGNIDKEILSRVEEAVITEIDSEEASVRREVIAIYSVLYRICDGHSKELRFYGSLDVAQRKLISYYSKVV